MQSKSETTNQPRSSPHSFTPNTVYSEPWWRGIHYNSAPKAMSGVNASNSSSLERPNADSESSEGQSLSNNGMNEEDDDATKESQPTAPNQSGAIDCMVKKKKNTDIEIRKESMCLYIQCLKLC